MDGGGDKADVAVGIAAFKHQLVGFACHEHLRCVNHHQFRCNSITRNHMKRGAARDVSSGHGDEPIAGVGRQVFPLCVERAVFGEPSQGTHRGQRHFIAVDIDKMWRDFLDGSCTNHQRVIENKFVRRTCCDRDGSTCFQLVVPHSGIVISDGLCCPCGLAVADVFAVDVPNHGRCAWHTVASGVEQVSGHRR